MYICFVMCTGVFFLLFLLCACTSTDASGSPFSPGDLAAGPLLLTAETTCFDMFYVPEQDQCPPQTFLHAPL